MKALPNLSDSSNIGAFVPILYAMDLEKGNNIQLNELMKNKYVFIDFWGSWCGPCISSIPKLKGLYEKTKDREDVLMLGLVLERESDLEKLKGIIDEKGVEWINFWMDSKVSSNTTSIAKKLNVQSYPTYLIIDNTGKIVYKEASMFKTEKAIDFFLNMIDD